MNIMNTEQSQNSIVSKIKVFEDQTTIETSGLPKKPEITPRSLPPKPTVSSGKPSVAPKPTANRASGEWDSGTENRLKVTSKEGLTQYPPLQEAGSIPVTKPELPKKPNPGLIRSVNPEIPARGPLAESSDSGKKVPTPAPRPLLLKKSVSSENPTYPTAPLKPVTVPPRLSGASQAKAYKSLGEGPLANPPVPVLQSKPLGDIDLISFDDDVLPTPSGNLAEESVGSEMVLESNHTGQTGGFVRGPRLPLRPVNGKAIPTQQPPTKAPPERPPPPKLSATRTSNKKLPFNRSCSDMDLQKKQSNWATGLSKAKSQVFKNQDPVLPPRPKPGHPLYSKYMRGDVLVMLKQMENNYVECQKGEDTGRVHLSQMKIITPLDEHLRSRPNDPSHAQKPVGGGAPHAVVLHDFPAEQVDDLSLTSGEIVYLLEKIDTHWYRGHCRNQTGIFPANYVKVIIDIPEGGNGKREFVSSHCVKGLRCVARFEYIGEQKDELSFSEGEIIILKEYVNEEWARGEVRGRPGIFPLNFVEPVEDYPTSGANVLSTKVPPKTKKEDSGSNSQVNSLSAEWCEALHSFTAETSDDLSFKRGDRIQILERVDSDWCRGRLQDREGIFPTVFVRPCPAEAKSTSAIILKGRKAKALYDFQGENEDELSFKAGDIITELESVDDDWMSGELMGKSGIFPKNYIQFLQVS
uniref:SH3 domain-containing protein 19 n=1 Tax=Cebus imitator TaxID=2715852 RepID=A0A2K5PU77_CEBIM